MEFIYPNSPIDLEMDDRRQVILSHTKPFVLPDWWHTTKARIIVEATTLEEESGYDY